MFWLQKIPSSLAIKFEQSRIAENRQGIAIATFIVFFAGAVLLIQHTISPGVDRHSFAFSYYRNVYFYCLATGIFNTLLFLASKTASITTKRIGNAFCVFLCINSGIALTIGDINFAADLSAYIWTLLLFDILHRGSFRFTALLSLYALLVMIAGIRLFQYPDPAVLYVVLCVYTVLSLIVWAGLEKIRRDNLFFKFDLEKKIAEKDITENELKQTQEQLVESAHRAGMAELAADTLHNIGNVMNSIHVSADVIRAIIKQNPGDKYINACKLIRENQNDIPGFFASNPKGRQLIDYLLMLEEPIFSSYQQINENIECIADRTSAIRNIISRQSRFTSSSYFSEQHDICQVIDAVIQLIPELNTDAGIRIEKDYEHVPRISLKKPAFTRILLNIFDNAVHALLNSKNNDKCITITVQQNGQFIKLSILDNGYGISAENLTKIFRSGFTTKKDGFGLDLHNAAVNLNEMGGIINIESKGVNQGTIVSISLPVI